MEMGFLLGSGVASRGRYRTLLLGVSFQLVKDPTFHERWNEHLAAGELHGWFQTAEVRL